VRVDAINQRMQAKSEVRFSLCRFPCEY